MLLIPRRIILTVSSVFLLLFIAISLATAIEARGPTPQIIQVHHAQAARVGDVDDVFAAKALLNGTDHDRSDGYNGSSGVSGATLVPTTKTETRDSFTPKPQTSANWNAEGVLGPLATPTPSAVPASRPPTTPQIPIVALTYSGAGGTKHCRGKVLQKTYFPPPLETWKKGTCITLPSEARCGVFYSNQGDNCEAQLFNMPNCYNTTGSYVNTVVFMPEERAVGALWSSMWVQCGVDVPEAKMLDPSILGGALKKPGSG